MRPNVKKTSYPVNEKALPPTQGMEFDYRTELIPYSQQKRAVLTAAVRYSFLAMVAVVGVRLGVFLFAAPLFLALSVLVGAVVALRRFVQGYSMSRIFPWLLCGPALFVAALFTDSFPMMLLCMPALAAAVWLAHRINEHYAAWMHANPHLTRDVRVRWSSVWRRTSFLEHLSSLVRPEPRERFPDDPLKEREANERREYSFSLAFPLAALLILPFIVVLVPVPYLSGMIGIVAYATVLFGWGCYQVRQYDRRIHVRFAASLVVKAVVSWMLYNSAHPTPKGGCKAAGVFQSPHGHFSKRWDRAIQILIAIALTVPPAAWFFPVGAIVAPGPWRAVASTPMPWDHALAYLERSLNAGQLRPQSSTTEANAPGTPPKSEYFRQLPDHLRDDYLQSQPARTTSASVPHPTAQARLTHSPEFFLLISGIGIAHGNVYLTISLVGSLLICAAAPLFVLFAVCFAASARLLAHHWLTLEGNGRHRALYHADDGSVLSLWDAYVQRLRQSRFQTVDRQRRPVRECDHLYLGIDLKYNYPVLLDPRVLQEHAHITGGSGTGKTSIALTQLAVQLIGRRDTSVVILDLKGEPPFFHAVRDAVEQANRRRSVEGRRPVEFRWFTNFPNRSTHVFNPFTQTHMAGITHSQRVETLLSGFGLHYGAGYGPAWFSSAHRHVLSATLLHEPHIDSFQKLHHAFQTRLPTMYRHWGIQSNEFNESGHLYGVVHWLSQFEALNVVRADPYPREVFDEQIDMLKVANEPYVVFFSLHAAMGQYSIAEVARLALFSLLAAATSRGTSDHHVYVFIDEFQNVVDHNLAVILEMARSNNIAAILAHQNLSQLRKEHAGDLRDIVLGSTRYKQIFSANDLAGQRALIDTSGEALYHHADSSVDPDDVLIDNRSVYDSMGGVGSHTYRAPTVDLLTGETTRRASYATEFPDGSDEAVDRPGPGQLGPRIRPNDVIEVSDVETDSFVNIQRGSGFSQFSGYTFALRSDYHIPFETYRQRQRAPWPAGSAGTVCSPATNGREYHKEPAIGAGAPTHPPLFDTDSPVLDPDEVTEIEQLIDALEAP